MSKHIEAVSNGMGGPSMYAFWLTCQGKIPATVSITADTGWEEDCLLSTGERVSARTFYEEVIRPLGARHGVDTRFVRVSDKHGAPRPSLTEYHQQFAGAERGIPFIPMFGSRGGRAPQRCTKNFKIMAIRQELRRMGATSARCAQALHTGEIRRMKGANHRIEDGWHTWNDIEMVAKPGREAKVCKWMSHYYPLIDLGLSRQKVDEELTRLSIPYIVGSQCDGCPHKDRSRWLRTSPETLIQLADIERRTTGWYFHKSRQPLPLVIERMRAQPELFDQEEVDFGCDNAVCGL